MTDTVQSLGLDTLMAETKRNGTDTGVAGAFAQTLQASAAEDAALEHVPAPTAPTAPAAPINDPASYMNPPAAPEMAAQPVSMPHIAQQPQTSLPGLPGGSVSPQASIALNPYRTVSLTTPVEAYGQMVSEIHFREPTWGDMVDIPEIRKTFLVKGDDNEQKMEFQLNFHAAKKWFARLTKLNVSVFRNLSRADGKKILETLVEMMDEEDTSENF